MTMLRHRIFMIDAFIAMLWVVAPAHADIFWNAPIVVEPGSPLGGAGPATAPGKPFFQKFDLQYRHSLYYPDFDGAPSRRIKTERLYNEQNITMRMMKSWKDYLWNTNLAIRRTDDPQIAPSKNHDWQLLNLQSTLAYKDRWDLAFGNLFPNYHRYALSTSLQGLQASVRLPFQNGHKLEVSSSAGRSARGVDGVRFTRWVTGAQAGWTSPDAWLGPIGRTSLHWSGSRMHDDIASNDKPGTLPRQDARAMALRLESHIGSGLQLDADWGLSRGRMDLRTAAREQNGGAIASSLTWRRPNAEMKGWKILIPGFSRASFEIVGEDYFAPQGAVGPDNRRWGLLSNHPLAEWVSVDWSLNRTEDNARRKKLLTNWTFSEGTAMNLSLFRAPLAIRALGLKAKWSDAAGSRLEEWLQPENFRMTFDARRTRRGRTDFGINTKNEDYSASFGHRMGAWSMGGRFGWQLTDNDIDATNDRRAENWTVSIGRPLELKSWKTRLQANAGYRDGYDKLRNGNQLTRNDGVNASLTAQRGPVSAGANWDLGWTQRNNPGQGSRIHAARVNLGYRPTDVPDLELTLTGAYRNVSEDNHLLDFRTRDVRFDATYTF